MNSLVKSCRVTLSPLSVIILQDMGLHLVSYEIGDSLLSEDKWFIFQKWYNRFYDICTLKYIYDKNISIQGLMSNCISIHDNVLSCIIYGSDSEWENVFKSLKQMRSEIFLNPCCNDVYESLKYSYNASIVYLYNLFESEIKKLKKTEVVNTHRLIDYNNPYPLCAYVYDGKYSTNYIAPFGILSCITQYKDVSASFWIEDIKSDELKYLIPNQISDNEELQQEWINDMNSITFPVCMNFRIHETGNIEHISDSVSSPLYKERLKEIGDIISRNYIIKKE